MKKLLLIFLSSILIMIVSFSISYEDFVIFNDFDTGFEIAEILDKNVLLIFTSSNCPYCTQLKENVIASENVRNFLINNYVLIELRADEKKIGHFDLENAKFDKNGKKFTYQELFYLFEVRGVPATFFFNKELEVLGGFPGYLPATDYLKWLKFVETEGYKNGDISTFELDKNYNGNMLVKSIINKELSLIEKHLPKLLTYLTYEKFKEMNLITTDPFQYYIIKESSLKEVNKYLEGLDKKILYNVYVLE